MTSLTNELGLRLQELVEVLPDIPDEKWPAHMMSIDKPSLTKDETAELIHHWSRAASISGVYSTTFIQLARFAQQWRQAIRSALNDLPDIAPLINYRDATPENQCSAQIRRGLQELLSSYNRGQAMDAAPSNIPDKHADVLSPMLERYKVMRKHFEHVRRIRDAIGDGAVPELRMPSDPLPAAVVAALKSLDDRRLEDIAKQKEREVLLAVQQARLEILKEEQIELARIAEEKSRATNLMSQSQDAGVARQDEKTEWRKLGKLEREILQSMHEHKNYIKSGGKRPSQSTIAQWVGCGLDTNLKNALSTLVKACYLDNLRQQGYRGGYGFLPKGERAGQYFSNGHD